MLQNQERFKKGNSNCRAEYDSLQDDQKELFKQQFCCAISISGQSSMVNVMRYINGKMLLSYAEKVMVMEIFKNFGIDEVFGVSHTIFFIDHFNTFVEINALNTQEND